MGADLLEGLRRAEDHSSTFIATKAFGTHTFKRTGPQPTWPPYPRPGRSEVNRRIGLTTNHLLHPTAGGLILTAWTAALALAGITLAARRDVTYSATARDQAPHPATEGGVFP
jgi:hypothetical protein